MTTNSKNNVEMQIKLKNYIVDGDSDGGIESDFFSQLKKMLSESRCHGGDNENNGDGDGDKISENEENICLLTKEPLQPVHIILACGHKFNYVPIYREVIAQKTTGLSSGGYYNSHSLKRNEIKCPYCRNIQDKLLPYLEFDGVKKMLSVNHPANLSMISQPCMYSSTSNLHSKKSKNFAQCKGNAVTCHNETYVCKKHYNTCLTTPPLLKKNTDHASRCGVILRYGKNKGKPCLNPSSCRLHKNKNENDGV